MALIGPKKISQQEFLSLCTQEQRDSFIKDILVELEDKEAYYVDHFGKLGVVSALVTVDPNPNQDPNRATEWRGTYWG